MQDFKGHLFAQLKLNLAVICVSSLSVKFLKFKQIEARWLKKTYWQSEQLLLLQELNGSKQKCPFQF